ncbi:uncharacterized protein LOC143342966 isoform X2 [Colletes latitarsis]
MDNTLATEKSRTLRSRKNSATSDISEAAEVDVTVTPTKKTRSITANEMFNKSNNRSSKRLIRAGSESKSPPTLTPVRNTRRTRASSMEPDIVLETKKTELHTPIKAKRRTSIAPSEATVVEENEETVRKSTGTVERTLPNVKELNETPVTNTSPKQINKLLVLSIEKMDTKRESIVENTTENDTRVEGAQNISAKNLFSNTSEDAETTMFVDDKKQTTNDNKTVSKQSENDSTDSVEKEDSLINVSEVHSQSTNLDASKELGLKVENLLSNSLKEQDEDLSNKENQAANIINDSLNKDDIISNVLLQSPKPLSASNINANKIIKEKCKSPSIDSTAHRHSKESSEAVIDTVVPVKEITDNSNATNTLADTSETITLIKEEDADSTDNMQKLELNTDTESLNMVPPDEPATKQLAVVEVCDDSSFDDSIQILECVESDSKPDDEPPTEVESKSKDPTKEDNDESHEDANIKMDVSSSGIEETTNTNTESTKDSTSPIKTTDNESETIEETDKSVRSIVSEDRCEMNIKESSQDVEHAIKDSEDAENVETVDATKDTEKANDAENVMETDALHSTETVSHSELSNATLSASLDSNVVENTRSFVDSKDESTTNNLENMEEAKESSDSHTCPEDSVPTNKNEDNVTSAVKSSQSSTVTETPAESSEEVAEKEELSQKTSVLDDSATPKKQSQPKLESSNEQKKAEVNLEVSKKNPENMEVDDNDSDTNTVNLFQDVVADEWKEKSDDVDKSSVHSMSTERLDNESETECDLVLVDREAWLAAENIKIEKEKEVLDYDSDDSVLIKARKDSSQTEQDDKTKDGGKKMNLRRSKASNVDDTRKSVQQEEIKDGGHVTKGSEDVENIGSAEGVNKKKSITKETKEKCTIEEDLNKSHSDSPLNKSKSAGDISKKRKSLNKSIQKMDNDREKSSETGSAKKKKSLNKSKSVESEIVDSDSKSEDICTTVKRNEKGQSSKKKIKPRQIDVNVSEESDDNSKQSEITSKKISATKKKTNEKSSHSDRDDSDSDLNKNNSDSDDSQNESVRLPKFLFDDASGSDDDNESNGSIDSDIQREYNLNGEDISKFSDDDVPGDECRASETESSDPDDDGSDLIDFVVDDNEEDEDEDEEEEEEEAGGEENEEEMDNDEEDEEALEDNEKLQLEQEMDEVEDETQEPVTEEADQSKNKQEIVDEKEAFNKEKTKLRKSLDTSLSRKIEDDKKEKNRSKTDTTQIEINEEHDSSNLSLSNSFKMKKTKQKCVSNEVTDDKEHSLNDSQLIFTKNVHKLSKSMEYSTPKSSLFKRDKFNVSLGIPSVESTNEVSETEEEIYSNVGDVENKTSATEKKLERNKNKENFMHRSFPSVLIEPEEKTNLSRRMSSQVTELNKSVPTTSNDSSTTRYLNKDKLNESAPELKSSNKFRKSVNSSINNEQNRASNSFRETNVNVEKPNVDIAQEVDDSLKKKLLKVADNIETNDRQKKRKKRKQPTAAKTDFTLFDENNSTNITEKNQIRIVSVTSLGENNEMEIHSNEKIKKQKKKTVPVTIEESLKDLYEEFVEAKSEDNDRPICNEGKKKKKRQKIIVDSTECTSTEIKVCTKKTGKNKIVTSEELTVEKLPNKKQKLLKNIAAEGEQIVVEKLPKKKQKLLRNLSSESEQTPVEQLPKKKQKVLEGEEDMVENMQKKKQKLSKDVNSEDKNVLLEKLLKKKVLSDVVSQDEQIPAEKVFKKKQKLSSKVAQSEEASLEKLPKKKQKLHQYSDTMSDLDEESEVVAFSKARDKALKMTKYTTDNPKTKKELKKWLQGEYMQQENQMSKKGVKRLSDEFLENLPDVPSLRAKKRKLSKFEDQVLPSRSMFDTKINESITVDTEDIIPLSSFGGTTKFNVVNLQKLKKKKKLPEIISFRQKILARNSRQPISAYLAYLQKQKASSKK